MAESWILMRFLIILLVLISGFPTASAQQGDRDPVATLKSKVVLEQGGQTYTAGEVLEAIYTYDPSLRTPVEQDPSYCAMYLASQRFMDQVHAFSDRLQLERHQVPGVDRSLLEAEAKAWAEDRKRATHPAAVLASRGLEIEVRARLIAQQPASYSVPALRTHMLRSVPEFFGLLQCSWIRLPLFDKEQKRALTAAERRQRYDKLDQVARMLTAEEIDWDQAVERYCADPVTRERKGAVGIIRRTQTDRYEEAMLRGLFADLGYKMPTSALLRGPLMGERWVYLVRIESLRIQGVVDLNLVIDRVRRSLRETTLQEQLQEWRAEQPAKILAPILLEKG